MKKSAARAKLEKNGYKVTLTINQGNWIASKNGRTYKANSINGLIKLIF